VMMAGVELINCPWDIHRDEFFLLFSTYFSFWQFYFSSSLLQICSEGITANLP